MAKCLKSPSKKIMCRGAGGSGKHRKGYTFNRYAKGIRGHSWNGHGNERICSRCGKKPKL